MRMDKQKQNTRLGGRNAHSDRYTNLDLSILDYIGRNWLMAGWQDASERTNGRLKSCNKRYVKVNV